ncbi:MAG: efflux RND transporter periplasmic adaptor subunit [Candidatus Obscuribacterales bacterium]|nr:efflux RND transporter periplasmic adaptor subunit [Candidatus Obscuribacterales bacterium]
MIRFAVHIAVLTAVGLCMSACTLEDPATPSPVAARMRRENSGLQTVKLSPEQLRDIKITTATVKKLQLPDLIDLTGQVEEDPTMTTPVISLVPGRITKVNVQLGDVIRAGDILAEVRSDEVAQIESDLLKEVLETDAQINETQVDLEVAKAAFDRQTLLFGEGIAARSEMEKARGEYEKTQVELRSLQTKKDANISATTERMKLYGVHPHEIQRLISTKTVDNTFDVVSPRNGIVVDRQVDLAQLIGSEDHLFVVSDLTRVWVVAQLFQRDISRVHKGYPVSMTVEGYADKEFKGRVDYISAAIDPTNRTLPVRATVLNPDLLLKPKMFGRMVVECGQSHVLAVPAEAVQRTGEVELVYVEDGPRSFKEIRVETGKRVDNFVEIISGLKSGEQVAVKGSLQLRGMAIQQVARSEEVED